MVVGGHILLLVDHTFMVLNFLAQVQVVLVLNASLLSQAFKVLFDHLVVVL